MMIQGKFTKTFIKLKKSLVVKSIKLYPWFFHLLIQDMERMVCFKQY